MIRIWISCFLMAKFLILRFFKFNIFWECVGPGPAHFLANLVKRGPAYFQNCLNFWSWKKKGFRLKNIFFFAFYERLSFFDGKYGYFSTFDQQISAENLVFRFLYCPFTKCLILANFLSKFWAEGSFQIKEQVASLPGVEISVDKKNFHFSPPRDAKQCRMMRTI